MSLPELAVPAPPQIPLARRDGLQRRAGLQEYLVYAAWILILFDPHHFLAIFVGPSAGKLATLTYLALLAVLLSRIPRILSGGRGWVLYPWYLAWLLAGLMSLPVAPNMGLVQKCLQILTLYWAVGVATPDLLGTPRLLLPLIVMFGLRFAWWEGWAGLIGYIPWHPTMSNYDGYGTLAAQGAGVCYWMALASQKRWLRNLLFLLAAGAVMGVVATQARGAFLSLAIVAGIVWLRSPNKFWTAIAIIGATVVALTAATMLFEGGHFWNEIMSSFTEGNDSGTGLQRWELWTAAMMVFAEHPIFGVGAGNVTIYASQIVGTGVLELFPNPSMLYGYNLHNAYVQVLAEWGIVGMIAFLALHIDFFVKNRALRSANAQHVWALGGGARHFSLFHVSLALEAGFFALMFTNLVYANLFEAWLVAFWTLTRSLWGATRTLRRPSRSIPRHPGKARMRSVAPTAR